MLTWTVSIGSYGQVGAGPAWESHVERRLRAEIINRYRGILQMVIYFTMWVKVVRPYGAFLLNVPNTRVEWKIHVLTNFIGSVELWLGAESWPCMMKESSGKKGVKCEGKAELVRIITMPPATPQTVSSWNKSTEILQEIWKESLWSKTVTYREDKI